VTTTSQDLELFVFSETVVEAMDRNRSFVFELFGHVLEELNLSTVLT